MQRSSASAPCRYSISHSFSSRKACRKPTGNAWGGFFTTTIPFSSGLAVRNSNRCTETSFFSACGVVEVEVELPGSGVLWAPASASSSTTVVGLPSAVSPSAVSPSFGGTSASEPEPVERAGDPCAGTKSNLQPWPNRSQYFRSRANTSVGFASKRRRWMGSNLMAVSWIFCTSTNAYLAGCSCFCSAVIGCFSFSCSHTHLAAASEWFPSPTAKSIPVELAALSFPSTSATYAMAAVSVTGTFHPSTRPPFSIRSTE
mmetsp:Transcript_15834/g.39163  ORF Transcript_15834/g.39163 Transcript_15834/m.39163 type:complete len:258 (-) Transcript_15834:1122-1895(-)